jgi:hypothetical protein
MRLHDLHAGQHFLHILRQLSVRLPLLIAQRPYPAKEKVPQQHVKRESTENKDDQGGIQREKDGHAEK